MACDDESSYYYELDPQQDNTQSSNSSSSIREWERTVGQAAVFGPVTASASSSNVFPEAPFSQSPNGRYGVCNRYASQAVNAVNIRADAAVREVRRQNPPAQIVNAHLTIIRDAHSRGMAEARRGFDDCVHGFGQPQNIINLATLGFSDVLVRAGIPEGRVRIDASEIVSGRPLGGHGALVPNAREQVLGGDRGTGANIVRDPIRCITFMRKC